MTANPDDKVEDLGTDIEPLGEEFEILDDAAAVAPPPGAAAPSAPAAPAPAPILSSEAWTGLGLGLAIGGLLGPWGESGGGNANLLHGLLLAAAIWHLLVSSLGAVNRTGRKIGPLVPGLLVVYGGARIALAGSDALADVLGWQPAAMTSVLGAWFTALGGLLVLGAKSLGKKKDAKLPAATGAPVDDQFSKSLLAYLMVMAGILMPWASGGDRGADSIFGMLTLACVVLALWASWVGTWKHWAMPIVSGKMGLLLFLAPTEAFILGLMGAIRHLVDGQTGIIGMTRDAWPSMGGLGDRGPFLVYGAGAVLTMIGSAFAFYELFHGAKAAMVQTKQRKVAEREARQAKRGGSKPKSDAASKSGGAEKRAARKGAEKKDRKARK